MSNELSSQFNYENSSHLHPKAPHRPAFLTQSHNFKGRLKELQNDRTQAIFGVCQGIPSVFLSKVFGQSDVDFVWLDGEHSLWDRSVIYDAIQAIHHHSEGRIFVFARVPKHDETFLTACLDAGVDGIMLPHTESKEEVLEMVQKVYYPPIGARSFSPWTFVPHVTGHSMFPNDLGSIRSSNEHIALIAQVESRKGIENIDEICSMPQVDALWFGPGDFRLDIGLSLLPSPPNIEPQFADALQKVQKAAKTHNICWFAPASDLSMLPGLLERGAQMILVMMDYWKITEVANKLTNEGKEILENFNKNNNTSSSSKPANA